MIATKFSKGVRLALAFLISIQFGEVNGLPKPNWENFHFFYRITATKPAKGRKRTGEGSPYQELTRRVRFYGYKGELLAVIWLKGHQFTSTPVTYWRVMKVEYRRQYFEGNINVEPDWFETSISAVQSSLV